MIKLSAARVGFVAEHETGPLGIAHCGGAAVGQQIDRHAVGGKVEEIVPGLDGQPTPLFARGGVIGSTTLILYGSNGQFTNRPLK